MHYLENSFQYLPLISVEFTSQKKFIFNNINMIVCDHWEISMLFFVKLEKFRRRFPSKEKNA